MAWSSALKTDCQHPGSGQDILAFSPEMPQPQRRWTGSAGCFLLPSVKRVSSVVGIERLSSIVGRAVGN
eukprot:2934879-Amphidinium_carterae.1